MSLKITFFLLFAVCACNFALASVNTCLRSLQDAGKWNPPDTVSVTGNGTGRTYMCKSRNGSLRCTYSSVDGAITEVNVKVECDSVKKSDRGSGSDHTNALSNILSLMVTIVAILHF